MKKVLCLVMALLLCLTTLPAMAELSLNPDQWTKPFDYTVKDYCDMMDMLASQMLSIKGEWHESDAPKGYRVLTFSGENVSDIVLLADKNDRVLAVGTEADMNLTDASAIAAKGQAFGVGMAAIAFVCRLVELDGDTQALVKEVETIQADLMTFQEVLGDLGSLLSDQEAMSKGAYKDIEAAGHHMNFVLKVSMTDMAMSFTSVFAPVAAQPE